MKLLTLLAVIAALCLAVGAFAGGLEFLIWSALKRLDYIERENRDPG